VSIDKHPTILIEAKAVEEGASRSKPINLLEDRREK